MSKAVELTREVKKRLVAKFGHKAVSVRGGRGTAYGWVEANVTVENKDCYCKDTTRHNGYGYCDSCKEIHNLVSDMARKAVYSGEKIEFYTYYSDDGYNTERDEFLLQVTVKAPELVTA